MGLLGDKPGVDKQALYRQWITHIQTHGEGLTEKEDEFIESVAEQVEEGRLLSQKQGDWLEAIYTHKVP